MSWFIEGNGEKLHLGVKESGNPSVWGDAMAHQPRPTGGVGDREFFERLEKSRCSWSIHPSTEPDLDVAKTELNERVRQKPDKCFASIRFHSDFNAVGVTIALPPKTFECVFGLFENVLRQKDINYLITLDFVGFVKHGFESDLPSIEEFTAESLLDQRDYISEEVSFVIRRNENDEDGMDTNSVVRRMEEYLKSIDEKLGYQRSTKKWWR